jgi:hypothetical protein
MKLLPALVLGVYVLTGFQSRIEAQGICVHETLTVSSISGKAVSQLVRGETPLHDITVKILEDPYKGRVIAQMVTGEEGVFSFRKKIKPGKYILEVSYEPYLATYSGRIVVVASNENESRKEIVVILGADFIKPCGGSYAELRAIKVP